ncbi:MAG TPA: ricin-type beta-trefoil lectin domain protein [Trebonia sp.]|jgi:hypothetical protein|nr:ricin-type beta-trefoil lectin domain protein [Trebonia sp.]
MNERRFRPELRVLAILAVAVVIAVWFVRSRSPSAPPAGTGPGIQVSFAAAHRGTSAAIGVDWTMPASLPGAPVRAAFAKLGLGAPALEIPDSDTMAAATRAVRDAAGSQSLVVITATGGESAAAYAARFAPLDAAVKAAAGQDAAPGVRVGAYIGGYQGTFLRTFLEDGGASADFVDFSFYGDSAGQSASEQQLLDELPAVSADISDARSVIAKSAPARAGDIGVYVGPWNITSAPAALRFTSFAALWDAALLGRILSGGAGSLADGSGLLYDGDGTAPRAYQAGSPAPLYAAVGMFTGSGVFPRFGTPLDGTAGLQVALAGVDAFASAEPDAVVVVNTSSSTRTTVLHIGGGIPMRAAQWRLGQASGAVSDPVSAGRATSRNGSFALSLPSGSVTTVVITATGADKANTVTVANASTGQCLATAPDTAAPHTTAPGAATSDAAGTVATAGCDNGPDQEWRLSGVTLVNKGTGRCLAGDSAGRVSAQACDGSLAQDWYNLGSRLASAQTGRCLNANGTAEVYALTCDDASQQNWSLTP